jgi:hypothetical protein
VVAPDSDTVTRVPLPFSATEILPFDAAAPSDPTVRHRALLYAAGQKGVSFVNLEDLESSTTQALQGVDLGASIGSVRQLPFMTDRLPIFLSGGGIDILDLVARHWSPINSDGPITLMIADSTRSRMWVTSPGETRIGFLDFGNDATQPTLTVNKKTQLDNPVQQFFRLDGANSSRIIVTHDQVGGAVTLLDAKKPDRSTAKKLEGFLFSDLL